MVSGFGFRVVNFRLRVSDFRFLGAGGRVWGCRDYHKGILEHGRVSLFVIRVSLFDFCHLSFGFRVSGSDFGAGGRVYWGSACRGNREGVLEQ